MDLLSQRRGKLQTIVSEVSQRRQKFRSGVTDSVFVEAFIQVLRRWCARRDLSTGFVLVTFSRHLNFFVDIPESTKRCANLQNL